MTKDSTSKSSFWMTLPGILTGVAALLTAIVGAVGLWHALTGGASVPSPSSGGATSSPERPAATPDNPVIVDVNTYREGPLVYVSVSYTDADSDAEGFGFRWAPGQETHPFSSPSFGRVSRGRIDYPFNLGCGQPNQNQIDVEFWIYDQDNRRSNYINAHLQCPGVVG